MRSGLILHCGAREVNLGVLEQVRTPEPTASHFPIPHIQLVTEAVNSLQGLGYQVESSRFALSRDDQRFFGLLEFNFPVPSGNYRTLVGLRNSHNKEWSAALAGGQRVFVCDNLSFTGEFVLARKHTRHIVRDLPVLMGRAVDSVCRQLAEDNDRFDRWREICVTDRTAESVILRAAHLRAIPVRKTLTALAEWRSPAHEEFRPRTAWSLFNAFTESMKPDSKESDGLHVERQWNRSPRLIPLIEQAIA